MNRHEIVIEELDEIIRQAQKNPARDGLPWSHRDLEILRKYYRKPGVTLRKLAKALNRSYSSIQAKVTRLGLSEEVEYQ